MNVRNARGDPEHRPAAVPRNGNFSLKPRITGKQTHLLHFFHDQNKIRPLEHIHRYLARAMGRYIESMFQSDFLRQLFRRRVQNSRDARAANRAVNASEFPPKQKSSSRTATDVTGTKD